MTADVQTDGVDLARTPDFQLGSLWVRPSSREVEGGRAVERLEPRVMQTLVALAERRGRVVSRDELIERCWDGRIVGDDAIHRCIGKIRRIGGAHAAFTIEAIARVGYRLAEVETGAAPAVGRTRRPRPMWLWIAAVSAVVLLGGAWMLRPAPLSVRTPFVVIPFETTSADPAVREFARTVSHDTDARLSQSRLPTGRGRGGRFEMKGIAYGDGREIRARVSLVDAVSGTVIWSLESTAPAAEASSLRAQLSSRLVQAAQITNETLVFRSDDLDPIGLSMAVRGIDSTNTSTWDPLTQAEALVKHSPRFGPGHRGLGGNLIAASVLGPAEQAPALRARALAETRKALALRPDDGIAHQSLQWLAEGDHWAERIAVMNDPRIADSYWSKLGRGMLAAQTGQLRSASLLLGQADIPDDNPLATGRMALSRLHDLDDRARTVAKSMLAVRPDEHTARQGLLDLEVVSGDPGGAMAILGDPKRRPQNLTPEGVAAYRAFLNWRQGRAGPDARGIILNAARNGRLPTATAVPLLARMGDLDGAFTLTEAYARNPRTLHGAMFFDPSFLYLPELAPLRRDPRFIGVADRLGLLRYWRESGLWPDFCESEPASVCGRMRAG